MPRDPHVAEDLTQGQKGPWRKEITGGKGIKEGQQVMTPWEREGIGQVFHLWLF